MRWLSGKRGEKRMSKYLAGLALFGLLGAGGFARADEVPKGPDEDGTKPALTRIAGEGMMNSHAFQYLTELSDDIGSRVTGSPAERKAEEWGAAKMKAMGLENVHTEKYQLWRGWTRGTAGISPCVRFQGPWPSSLPRPTLRLFSPRAIPSPASQCHRSVP